jgi:hypothetical protein
LIDLRATPLWQLYYRPLTGLGGSEVNDQYMRYPVQTENTQFNRFSNPFPCAFQGDGVIVKIQASWMYIAP